MGTPILGHGTAVMTPILGFSIRLGPYLIHQHNPIDPIFLQKNRFASIPFSSGDTKVGAIFLKMFYLTDFKHFISIFSLIVNPIDHMFH